jgi:hypothetical protein
MTVWVRHPVVVHQEALPYFDKLCVTFKKFNDLFFVFAFLKAFQNKDGLLES